MQVAARLDLRALGEFGLIEAIRRRAGDAGRAWRASIGDDGAVLRAREGRELVLTADALVEDVHFRWRTTDARSLGRKALAVNLSDLGAMGATPLGFLLTLCLPGDPRAVSARQLDGVLGGMLAEAKAAGCPLVGGDTVRAPCWSLQLTAVGDVPRGRALTRAGARPGDRLLVTGSLGGAALGLRLLEAGRPLAGLLGGFARRQILPRPPWRLGARLVRARLATAAIDLSDGFALDLEHLTRQSRVAAEVQVEALPLARGLRAACPELGLDPLQAALHGGEDYELLFCVPHGAPSARALSARLGVRLSEVGVIRRGRGVRFLREGRPAGIPVGGYDHFKPSAS